MANKNTPSPAPSNQPETTQSNENKSKKNWKILLYIAADNNLSEECIFSLLDIQKSITTGKIVCVAQLDPKAEGVGTKRYIFTKTENSEGFIDTGKFIPREPILESNEVPIADEIILNDVSTQSGFAAIAGGKSINDLPSIENSADPRILENFLTYGIKHPEYPAKHHLVVLSGHGNGAIGDFLMDENPASALGITDLSSALNRVKKRCQEQLSKEGMIDVLGLDSCLMSMIEVCCELSDSVGILIGSEGFMLNAGWPYGRILDILNAHSSISAPDLAKSIVVSHIDYYSNYLPAGVSVDLSACDLKPSKINTLTEKVANLVDVLLTKKIHSQTRSLKPHFVDAVILAHWRAQSYKFELYTDLYDFCDELIKSIGSVRSNEKLKVHTACLELQAAIRSVVLKASYCGVDFQYSHGLSVYFPWSKSETKSIIQYNDLAFATATGWAEFLYAYVRDTQRPIRDHEDTQAELWPPIAPGNPSPVKSGGLVRTIPELGFPRTNPELGLPRTNPELGLPRTNPELGLPRGKILLVPKVKNAPNQVLKGPQNGTPKPPKKEEEGKKK